MLAATLVLLAWPKAAPNSINVFAAASLKEAFTTIAANYEQAHPGAQINLNFAGSQLLAAQINGGAPADVFASADQTNLDKTQYDKTTARIFVRNQLTLVFRSGLHPHSPRDLSAVDRIVVADDAVPVGNYTSIFFQNSAKAYGADWLTQVAAKIVSKEQDVKAVLAKVQLGEADAGVVYVSDAKTAQGPIEIVGIPDKLNTIAEYPVAVPSEAPNAAGGRDFVQYLLSPQSQSILKKDGFLPAPKNQPKPLAAHAGGHRTSPVSFSIR